MQYELLTFVKVIHPILRQVDPAVQRALGLRVDTVVIDANVVFRDLRAAYRRGRPTILAEAMQVGYLRVFAPIQLQSEVLQHLPKLESKWRLGNGQLETLWRVHYVPHIIWINVAPSAQRPLVSRLERRDPKDTPYLEVYEHIGAAAVLTADNDMRDMGVATGDWFQYIRAHQEEFQEQAYVASVNLGAICLILGAHSIGVLAFKAATALIRELMARFSRLPVLVQITILLALTAALANPIVRARLAETFRRSVNDLNKGLRTLGEVAVEIMGFVQEHQELAVLARQRKGLPAFGPGEPRFARDYVVRVLVGTCRPLSTAEVARQVLEMGYESKSGRPERYIKQVLGAHPNICYVRGKGWQLTTSSV